MILKHQCDKQEITAISCFIMVYFILNELKHYYRGCPRGVMVKAAES